MTVLCVPSSLAFVIEKLREMFVVPPIDESRLWLQHLNDRTLLSESDTMGENKSSCSVEDDDVCHLYSNSTVFLRCTTFCRYLFLKLKKMANGFMKLELGSIITKLLCLCQDLHPTLIPITK